MKGPFIPTHEIEFSDSVAGWVKNPSIRKLVVSAVQEPDSGRLLFYTRLEWEREVSPLWELDTRLGMIRNGALVPPGSFQVKQLWQPVPAVPRLLGELPGNPFKEAPSSLLHEARYEVAWRSDLVWALCQGFEGLRERLVGLGFIATTADEVVAVFEAEPVPVLMTQRELLRRAREVLQELEHKYT